MLERARARGEAVPDALDGALAPIYVRALFGAVPLAPDCIDDLVDNTLARRPG